MEITLRPTLKQHLAYEALNDQLIDTVFLGGGAGGGKSWFLCESRLINCYLFPGYKSFIAREELKRLMQSTYVTWCKVCAYHKIPQDDWHLNGQYNYIEFKNGSRIDLIDTKYLPSDPLYERFGSMEYSDGAFEEAGEIDVLAYDVLGSRVNRHLNRELGIKASKVITGNPKKNWTYSMFYKPWSERKLPSNIAFIQSLYGDNPHTAEDYGKTLSAIKDERIKRRLRDGDWEYDEDPAKLIDYDAICDLFTNKTPPLPEEKYLTIDVARMGKDKAVIMRWEGWQIKEIKVYPKCTIDTLQNEAESLCNTYFIPRSHVMADEDGIGGGFVDNFKCKGFVNNSSCIQPPEAIHDAAKRLNFANLKTQCAFMLADKINARAIGIDTREFEEHIKEELEQVKQDNVDSERKIKLVTKDVVKDNIGRSPDFSDTMLMRMRFEINRESTKTNIEEYERGVSDFLKASVISYKTPLGIKADNMREYEQSLKQLII